MVTMPTSLRLRRSRRRPVAEPELELADIQGNILRPYGFQHAAFLFVRIDEAAAGRRWLAEHTDEVTSAEPWEEGKPLTTLNIRLTYPGLEALGVPERTLASFPEVFRAGMAARAALLGDVGANSPAEWEPGLGTGEAHVLLRIDSQEEDALVEEVDRARRSVEGVGSIVNEQFSAFLPSGRNHFGYVEGAGAVAILGAGVATYRGEGVPEPHDGWRPMKP